MSNRTALIQALKDALSNLDVANLQDFKNIIAQVNTLSDDEIQDIYKDIGGVATESQIGLNAIESLPYPVAILLQETNKQRNDLVRLLFLMESVECLVRWRLGQALSLIHAERNWTIPDGLLGDFSKKILKPSMGIWIGGFERIAKQIQHNESVWGVDVVKLLTDIDLLNLIVQIRNNIAHGDIMGDATAYLKDTKEYAEDLFNRYAALEIEHFVVVSNQTYRADGPQITLHNATITLSGPADKRLDKSSDYYCFTKTDEPILQHPVIFRIFNETPTMDGLTHPFSTGSFISTHKDCRTVKSGGTLVYSLVDGKSTPEISELSDFVRLFKTNIKVMANLPWRGLFEELGGYAAWKIDRNLIKHCRQEYSCLASTGYHAELQEVKTPEKLPQAKMWYFGGGPEIGKSTLLLSYLETTSASGALVFPFRFKKNNDQYAALDGFLRAFRDAIVYWLRQYDEVSMPDTSLTGEDLFKDVDTLLKRLCAANTSIELILGLDDLHHLYIHENLDQPVLNQLLKYIEQWGRFTHTKIRTNFDRKTRTQTFDNECHRQVFVLATGMDQGDEQQDIDNFLAKDERVSFVYMPSHVKALESHTTEPKKKSDHPLKQASSRYHEMQQHTCQPTGAHMPPVQTYGAIDIMHENQRNTKFGKHMEPDGPGHRFIADTLNVANGNPLIIDAIAENLHSGTITIEDPVTHKSYTLATAKGSPYLENTSYIVPTILCFMHTLKVPLTIESLQILCSNSTTPNPTENTWISQALYTIPQYIEKVSLYESNEDGTLAIGWRLRPTNPTDLLSNLGLVQTLTDGRIQYLVENRDSLYDSLQLKSVLRKHAGVDTQPSNNPVQDVFAALRGALTEGVLETLNQFSNDAVLQRNADMLYQTATIAPASITWLQKASENAALCAHAKNYANSASFEDVWLKHVNAERTPLFDHELANIGYVEKIEKTIPINDDFYVVVGLAEKGLHNSIAVYHHQRTQPDLVLLSLDSDEKAIDCVVVWDGARTACVAMAIDSGIHLHTIDVSDRARFSQCQTYDYDADIVGLVTVESNQIAVFGKKSTDTGWVVDLISNVMTNISVQTFVSQGATNRSFLPKYGFHIHNQSYITFGKTVVQISSNGCSPRHASEFTPASKPLCWNDGCLLQKGTRANHETIWFSSATNTFTPLHNQQNNTTFAKIVFADTLPSQQLLTVDYTGVLRIFSNNTSTPVCEMQLHISTLEDQPREINGGLFHDGRLMLYGTRGFMAFYDLGILLKDSTSTPSIHHIDVHMHFGTIKGAQPLQIEVSSHNDLFLTWSEDNDVRLWSWTAGSASQPDDFCLGLFRGHNAKVKGIHTSNHRLVSIDEKQNLRTWLINDGAIQQRTVLTNIAPAFVKHVMVKDNMAWSVSTANNNIFVEQHANFGASWSATTALQQQNVNSPTTLSITSNLNKVTMLGQYIIMLETNQSIHVFDTLTNRFVTSQTLSNTPVENWHKHQTRLLLNNKQELYQLDETLNLQKIHTTPSNQSITVAKQDENFIHFAVTITEEKEITRGAQIGQFKTVDTDIREIYELDSTNQRLNQLTQINSSAKISGLNHQNGHLLFWVTRTNTPLDLFWLNIQSQTQYQVPNHSLLIDGLKSIHPTQISDGFAFKSGDNDRLWTLHLDYPIVQDDSQSKPKKPLLSLHSDWEYVSKHFDEVLQAFADKPTAIQSKAVNVFADSSPFGVLLYYKQNETIKHLLWTGSSLRDFSVINVHPDGFITLYKNREVIVLRVMRGDQGITLSDLTTS